MPEAEAPVELVYTLNVDDLAAFSRMRIRRRRGRWEPAFYLAMTAGAFAYGAWALVSGPRWSAGVIALGLGVLLLATRFVFGPFALRSRFRQLRLGEHPIRLTADAETLRLTGGADENRTAWSALKRIDRTEDHYFFWINNLQAIIVPLRAIGSEIERRRLWEMASRGTGVTNV
jgi:hypothetical protein